MHLMKYFVQYIGYSPGHSLTFKYCKEDSYLFVADCYVIVFYLLNKVKGEGSII